MTLRRTFRLLALMAALAWTSFALADEALWTRLKGGGQVVLIRHALTTPGVGDPEGMKLDDCGTQRNLSDEGRAHARQLGEAFRRRGITVGRLLSSPWCRSIETAKLAFGATPVLTPALGNLFGRSGEADRQLAGLRPLAGQKPANGNTVMVSHGSTIAALTGIAPDTGEMVVLTPQGDGRFKVAGRMTAHTP
ncbi:histidine phosphatase family protein [Polaromonas sp. YR568]|uniref:histidine phosphatase family protein n=1 Tax=Polaromonas sp. YR568 TaxID=1855301 RepID=UPI00398BD7FD